MSVPRGRGSTGTGRGARLPGPDYGPAPAVVAGAGGVVVDFVGEDGRRWQFPLAGLPLPGWHAPVAAALAVRAGPAGGIRTLASAQTLWDPLQRFIRFLGDLPDPPLDPSQVTGAQIQAFLQGREAVTHAAYAWSEIRIIAKLLELSPLRDLLSTEVRDFLARRQRHRRPPGKVGYSDGELSRLVTAARRDAAAIRDRLDAGHTLLAQFTSGGEHLDEADRGRGAVLAAMATTGVVPRTGGAAGAHLQGRLMLASALFLTRADLAPLLILFVAVSGRNVETIKELPLEHRILEERAVQVRLLKRRRGQSHWSETVTWEIGPPGRELHTPGGLYLLLHRLTTTGRTFSGAQSIWSAWRNGNRAGLHGADEHHDPFARELGSPVYAPAWVKRHGLRTDQNTHPSPAEPDDADASSDAGAGAGELLSVDFNRLKTSIDVRRTKQMGGHLPSSALTNTVPVLFRHYLRGDPTTISWAQDIVTAAFADAEQAALNAHHQVLHERGAALLVVPEPGTGPLRKAGLDPSTATHAERGDMDTAWSACTDPEHGPISGHRCEVSFLDCFHCANALITPAHLPRLLGLLEALSKRHTQMSEQQWWARYGPTWSAIRHDVLSRFTPEQVTAAQANIPTDVLLDLVENPWGHP